MNVYDKGDTIRFTAKFSKAEVTTAPNMAFVVATPTGSTETVAAETAHTATEWRFNVDYYVSPSAAVGVWKYRFASSGSASQVESAEFLVRAPLV